MPSRLEKRLTVCDSKIDNLFRDIQINAEIERQLKEIKEYYRKLYIDADEYHEESCIALYEFFVTSFDEIKSGGLKSEDVLKEIDDIKSLRKAGVVLDNLLNLLELLFWATAACSFLSVCVLAAPPIAAANPFLALALLASACAWATLSVVSFFDCINRFKSSTPIEEQYEREKSLLLFFKPAELSAKPSSKLADEDAQTEQQYERLYPILN
jgi:hypothetical protein